MRSTEHSGETGVLDSDDPETPYGSAGISADEYVSRLSLSRKGGYIWVDSQREIMMSVPMFTDLIATVFRSAASEAPTVLYEIGRASGIRWAQKELAKVARLQDRISVEEAYYFAAQVCGLGGYGELRFLGEKTNADGGRFVTLELLNSAEVEAHRATDSYRGKCCWMQTGFLSSYLSILVGEIMTFHEAACRGQGHRTCKLVGTFGEEAPQLDRPGPTPSRAVTDVPAGAGADNDADNLIVGNSAGITQARELSRKVAPTTATVLLLGPSGVGKELFAREIHRLSDRRTGPFIAVNCGAIPDTLIESELFGTEKGAFSGAYEARPGRFERAHGGTLFLDEIASLSAAAQVKLLRALQEGYIERLGATVTVPVDTRIVCACNVDLRAETLAGRFREDLYYRLNTFTLYIPALCERREDIPDLVNHYLRRYSKAYDKHNIEISTDAWQALLSYEYPGNIRELASIIERAVILVDSSATIRLADISTDYLDLNAGTMTLHSGSQSNGLQNNQNRVVIDSLLEQGATLADIEAAVIDATLDFTKGNITQASKMLGVTRRQLSYRLNRQGVDDR